MKGLSPMTLTSNLQSFLYGVVSTHTHTNEPYENRLTTKCMVLYFDSPTTRRTAESRIFPSRISYFLFLWTLWRRIFTPAVHQQSSGHEQAKRIFIWRLDGRETSVTRQPSCVLSHLNTIVIIFHSFVYIFYPTIHPSQPLPC